MSYASISTALAARIIALNMGTVSAYERFTAQGVDQADFQTMFVTAGVLNTWFINRTSVKDKKPEGDDSRYRRQHAMVVKGVLAFNADGNTSLAFQAQVDSLMDDLRTGDHTLGGACLTYSAPEVVQIVIGTFQGKTVLVHAAQLELTVEEIL